MHQIIHIRTEAPPKPALGQPCNGCGICCLAEPCPLGVMLSRRRIGACVALRWDAPSSRYRCGCITEPRTVVRWIPASWLRRLALRWIAAGRGCDSDAELL